MHVSTIFYKILQDFARFCKKMQDSLRLSKILQNDARFYNILQDFATFFKVVQGFDRFKFLTCVVIWWWMLRLSGMNDAGSAWIILFGRGRISFATTTIEYTCDKTGTKHCQYNKSSNMSISKSNSMGDRRSDIHKFSWGPGTTKDFISIQTQSNP